MSLPGAFVADLCPVKNGVHIWFRNKFRIRVL